MRLNDWKESWELHPEWCPCDVHFLDYLRERGIGGKSIFHFGSGAHHVLGTENLTLKRPNEILAITASRPEHAAYAGLIVRRPEIARHYKVLFADIYTLTPALLPRFDLVTLFHLGEYHHPKRSAYAQLDDRTLLALFMAKLNRGGRLFFYPRSNGAKIARPLIERAIAAGRLTKVEDYKSLLVCRR